MSLAGISHRNAENLRPGSAQTGRALPSIAWICSSARKKFAGYLLGLRQRGVARGTFQTSRFGLRFFSRYHHTLERTWGLFGEKRIASPRQKRAA